MALTKVEFILNGKATSIEVESRELLVHALREQCKLTGTHIGCDTSHCGACTVDLNGESIKSCTVLAVQAQGGDILTVEGLADENGLHPLQEGFKEEHGLQCGFCTPGLLIRSYRFLKENDDPTEQEIRMGISGNLCRCTGYQNIVKSIQYAANKIKNAAEGEA